MADYSDKSRIYLPSCSIIAVTLFCRISFAAEHGYVFSTSFSRNDNENALKLWEMSMLILKKLNTFFKIFINNFF